MYTLKVMKDAHSRNRRSFPVRSVVCPAICHFQTWCVVRSFFSDTLELISTASLSAISIAGIICEKLNVLCESQGFDVHFANVYLEAIDFVSIRCVPVDS